MRGRLGMDKFLALFLAQSRIELVGQSMEERMDGLVVGGR